MGEIETFEIEPILNLPIFPLDSNFKYKTQNQLSAQQQVLLDNLLASRDHYDHFLNTVKALDQYFKQENEKFLDPSTSQPVEPPTQSFSSQQERKKEWQEAEIGTELKTPEKENRENFERILEVKNEVLKLVLKSKQEEFITQQEVLRMLTQNPQLIPPGMALTGFSYCQPKHTKIPVCSCEPGFMVIKCSFNLKSWIDNQEVGGLKIKLLDYLKNGYVSRIIITKSSQLEYLKEYWQLCLILNRLLPVRKGFVNLEIRSIPPGYETGYPDDARHWVTIRVIEGYPKQTRSTPKEFLEFWYPEETKSHLELWRAFELSYKYDKQIPLIHENKLMKLYMKPIAYVNPHVPFGSIISHMPEETRHFRRVRASTRVFMYGDRGSNYTYWPEEDGIMEEVLL